MIQPHRPFEQLGRQEWLNLGRAGVVLSSGLLIALFLYQDLHLSALGNDFIHFHGAAHALLNGANPYAESRLGYYHFISPLWAALPYLWLGDLPRATATNAWLISNLLLMAASTVLAVLIYDLRPALWVWPGLFLLGLIEATDSWITGQPTIVIIFMLCLCLWLLTRTRQLFLAGLCGLVFLSIKPQLTLPVMLALLVWGSKAGWRRFWLGTLVSLGAVLAVTLYLVPGWPYNYLTSSKIEDTLTEVWTRTTLLDWLHYSLRLDGWPVTALYLVWLAIGGLACSWFFVQGWQGKLDLAELIAIILGIWMAVTFYTRDYDYAMLVLPVTYVLSDLLRVEKQTGAKLIGATLLAFSLLYYIHGGQMYELFIINVVIAGLVSWRGWLKVRSANKKTL